MPNIKEATFAGGCFWGVENSFMQLDGIMETTVGYMGGKFVNPTYFDVCSGLTGHAEVVNIKYDEGKLDLMRLKRRELNKARFERDKAKAAQDGQMDFLFDGS